jgi:hypothetical protein
VREAPLPPPGSEASYLHTMTGINVTTDRLELVMGTVGLARAECSDRSEFARLLDAHVPGH